MAQYHYFVADFDKIQRYIFETNKLREMAGASALVAELTNRAVKEELLKSHSKFGKGNLKIGNNGPEFDDTVSIDKPDVEWELIYADGGNVKALFKSDKAVEGFEAIMQRLFNEKLGVGAGTFSAATKCFDGDTVRLEQVAEEAERALKVKKAAKPELIHTVTAPFFRICSSCGIRESEQEGEEENEWLCGVCARKRMEAEKSWMFRDFAKTLAEALRRMRDDSLPESVTFKKEFDDIAASYNNYLGIVVIDGNRMGEVVRDVLKQVHGNLAEQSCKLREFSQSATKLSHDSVAKAIAEDFKKDDMTEELAFRPIILGGDDIVFVLRADRALEVARRCCELFEDETERLQQEVFPRRVTYAAGVAIVKKGFPFFAGHALAEALVRSAKQKNRQVLREEQGDYSTLDFLVLTSSDVTSLSVIREKEMQYEDPLGGVRLLTGKPYLLEAGDRYDNFDTLVKITQLLYATLPANKRHTLRTVMRRGEIESHAKLAQMLVRAPRLDREEFVKRLCSLGGIWRKGELNGRSVKINQFLDMLELIEFYKPARQEPMDLPMT